MQNSGVFAALSDQVKKTIVDFVSEGLNELEPMHPKLFKQLDTTSKFIRKQSIAPFGAMPTKSDGAEYSFDQIMPGYTKDFTPVEYGFGFQWSQTAQEDDEYDVLAQKSKWLGFSARVLQETQAALVYTNAFTTQTTADGVALSSTSHTLKRGGTASNRAAVDSDLTPTSLATMRALMRTQTKLESGQLVRPAKDLYLVHHPSNEGLVVRLLKSEGLQGTANNDTNEFKQTMDCVGLTWEYLADEDAWFLQARKTSAHGLIQVNRLKPKLSAQQIAWQTGNMIVTIRCRQIWDSFDWRNFAGTPGA